MKPIIHYDQPDSDISIYGLYGKYLNLIPRVGLFYRKPLDGILFSAGNIPQKDIKIHTLVDGMCDQIIKVGETSCVATGMVLVIVKICIQCILSETSHLSFFLVLCVFLSHDKN